MQMKKYYISITEMWIEEEDNLVIEETGKWGAEVDSFDLVAKDGEMEYKISSKKE